MVSCSPIRILVIDESGRRSGHDLITGQLVNEIPDAYVSEPGQEHQLILLPSLPNEQLQIMGHAVDAGPYQVGTIYASKSGELIEQFAVGQAVVGQDYHFSFETAFPQEINGQVVLEAESFTWNFGLDNKAWITQTTLTGYTGTSYLKAVPNIGVQFIDDFTTTSPQLRYTMNFTTTGTYYVWLRGYAPSGASDSIYIGLDPNGQFANILTGFLPRTWSWSNTDAEVGPVTIEVTEPGIHTLYLWQREDGVLLDRVLLTTDNNYVPIENGPPESIRLDSLP